MFFQSWSHHHKAVEQLYPIYVSLAKTKHVLEQLLESGLYTEITLKEVEAGIAKLHRNVDELRRIARERATASPMTSTASDHSAAGAAAGDAPKASKGDLAAGALAFGPGLALVESKLQACNKDLASLRAALAAIDPALLPLHTRLIEIKHELASLLARHSPHAFSLAEVQILQDDLREIDSIRIDGKFLGKDDGAVLPGQAAVIWLLEACYDDVHELLALREAIGGDNPLRPVYERLVRIKGRLERAYTVAKWNMRMDDLVPLQIELGEIDNLRVDGNEDRDGDQAPHSTSAVTTATTTAAAAAAASAAAAVPEGQAVLHFLLHKCYRIVYKLQMAAEPVADALMPVYASLATLQRCLLELKKWRVRLAPRDLAMYQMRLAKIDDMRVDGRFYGEENGGGGGGGGAAGAAGAGQQQAQQGEVPEGQGVLHAMLDACYELLRELQSASESADDEDEIDLDDDDDDGDFDDDGYGDEDDREEDD
ncbi:hypothetical protein DFJ73DRAFT_871881 [Zopfochytrium polystomum]|nr:hypothetical protein DFJ73DRAFT_871881 [Zopfochytrium polystomum]